MEENYKQVARKLARELERLETERDEIFDLWVQNDYVGVVTRALALVSTMTDLPPLH